MTSETPKAGGGLYPQQEPEAVGRLTLVTAAHLTVTAHKPGRPWLLQAPFKMFISHSRVPHTAEFWCSSAALGDAQFPLSNCVPKSSKQGTQLPPNEWELCCCCSHAGPDLLCHPPEPSSALKEVFKHIEMG